MYPSTFEYYQPKTLNEAIGLLKKTKDAKILAGGHSLIPAMKLRVASPSALIDIGRLKALSGIKASKTSVKIGSLTTHSDVASSKEIAKLCPVLAEAASQIGDLQVRNRGTIGGSLAHADPAADYPTVMAALGATFEVSGPKGKRVITAEKFFMDLFTTALKPAEVLTAVSVKAMKAGTGGAYVKHRHPASSYAVVGVAAVATLKNGSFAGARVAVGGATPNPILVTVQRSEEVAGKIRAAIKDPLGDLYASGEFRTHLATVLAGRALATAIERAKKQK